MKYNRPGLAMLPDGIIWYYITQVSEDNSYIRLFFPGSDRNTDYFNLDTGEVVELPTGSIDKIDAVFAKFFAKEAGLSWYAD